MIRVIAFDLDDTLWHVDPVIRRAEGVLKAWLEDRVSGFVYDRQQIGGYRHAVVEEQPELVGRMTDFRRAVLDRALAAHGVAVSPRAEILDEAIEVFLTARNEIEFFEGVLETIATLAEDFTLGALSNGNADIHRLGLAGHFSFAFSAEDVGSPKPAPDLFHAALDHIGCKPEEMVYVGDDPVKDVDASNAVGIHSIWLQNTLRPGPGETSPDAVIEDIRQLPQVMAALIAR
jgi:putative hydrolase of the HAD superfamily